MAIKVRRIKSGQVVGFQTINELFGNDAALQAQIDASSGRLGVAEIELGAQADRLDAAEELLAQQGDAIQSHRDRLGTMEGGAASLADRVLAAEGTAGSALMIAQGHTPTLANHGNRINALEDAIGGSDRYLASGQYRFNRAAWQYELIGGDPNGVLPAICPDPNQKGSARVVFASPLPSRFYGVSVFQSRGETTSAPCFSGWAEKEKDHLVIDFFGADGEHDAVLEFSIVIH